MNVTQLIIQPAVIDDNDDEVILISSVITFSTGGVLGVYFTEVLASKDSRGWPPESDIAK